MPILLLTQPRIWRLVSRRIAVSLVVWRLLRVPQRQVCPDRVSRVQHPSHFIVVSGLSRRTPLAGVVVVVVVQARAEWLLGDLELRLVLARIGGMVATRWRTFRAMPCCCRVRGQILTGRPSWGMGVVGWMATELKIYVYILYYYHLNMSLYRYYTRLAKQNHIIFKQTDMIL